MSEPAPIVCGVRDWADVATAEVAASLALALGRELTLIHVLPASGWRAPAPGAGLLEPPWDDDAAYRLLDAVAAAAGAVTATRVVAYGPPGRTLAREAAERDAAALVIGGPTYGLVGSALTGSASTHLLYRAGGPLVVCPSAGSASGSW